MERNIRLNWETITQEARRRRKARRITQSRIAALAKVSRSTVVRFESNEDDIQLSSALRILSVLDMFAPNMGPGAAMEPRYLANREALKDLLKELQVDPESQRRALADLDRGANTSIPSVLLSMDELQQYWPIQFSSQEERPASTD